MNRISEGIFSECNADWYSNYYKRLTNSAIEMVSGKLTDTSHYVKRLDQFIGNKENSQFFCNMIDLVNSPSPLAVICHGDCWTNNFLYKYNEHGQIIETCLVDFQLIRFGSPALDISNLIFCCTDKTMRAEHMMSFLKVYHQQLVKSLKRMGPMPAFCGDEDELWIK